MTTPRFWTAKRVAQLRRSWMAGSTNAQIAMKMRTTQSAIQDALPRFGMRYRPDIWPPKRIAQFKKLWADDSLTQKQIAKKIGFDDGGSVGKKAPALQLPARTPHWTEAEVARLKRLWEKTRSPSLIAERLGCSISSVNGQIRRLDLPTIEHNKWTPARDKLLKRLCIADPQLSSQQLALQLGCTPSAANAQRRRLDLPRPKPGRRA
jgi:hypothetical protein